MFLYKSEFAERYGIPREELRIAMNVRWLSDLITLGYKTTSKKLSPKVIKFLKEKFGIEDTE